MDETKPLQFRMALFYNRHELCTQYGKHRMHFVMMS